MTESKKSAGPSTGIGATSLQAMQDMLTEISGGLPTPADFDSLRNPARVDFQPKIHERGAARDLTHVQDRRRRNRQRDGSVPTRHLKPGVRGRHDGAKLAERECFRCHVSPPRPG